MTTFKTKVIKFIQSVPKGRVVSYGQIAAICGKPKGARVVGWILRRVDTSKENIPWWRVINSKGQISIKGNWAVSKQTQRALLKKDGVQINEDFILDINKYRYEKKIGKFKKPNRVYAN